MTRVVLIVMLAFFSGCSSRPVPKDILVPGKMRPIVYDLIRADELVNNYMMRDSTLNINEQHIKMYEQVFKIHKTSREEFYKSFHYYQAHPNISKVLLDSLLSYANNKQRALHSGGDSAAVK